MKLRALSLAIILSFTPTTPTLASNPLSFIGHWASTCEFFGATAQCELEWRAGLHPSLVEMQFTVLDSPASIGNETEAGLMFKGRSVLKQEEGAFRGFWQASNGDIHPLFARLESGTLTSYWGEAATELGRSEYQLLEDGSLQVKDWVLTDEGWQLFMEVEYQRR